ncbi:probable prolyl 4-hydroxylase 10 [Vicia villosa]|uniref:probable prolyl 4-hydroxylase 10 n=1 Tax=Vicia villosa TaxID=3911 RepID=UPI00273CAB7F|nr:probable prolyl 4-hydroxylase 10 [Vicia villosa]
MAIPAESFPFCAIEPNEEHGEGLQVLHYEVGQKNVPHLDYFEDKYNTLNMVDIGVHFVYFDDIVQMLKKGKKGLSIKPKMSDAIFFWSMKPNATLDTSSLYD